MTSRSQLRGLTALNGARRIVLGMLSPDEAVALLCHVIGQDRVAAEPGMAARVAALCGFLPLALRIAAEHLACRPWLTLRAFAAELAEGGPLARLGVEGDPATSVCSALAGSCRVLEPAQAALFAGLGRLPLGDFGPAEAARVSCRSWGLPRGRWTAVRASWPFRSDRTAQAAGPPAGRRRRRVPIG